MTTAADPPVVVDEVARQRGRRAARQAAALVENALGEKALRRRDHHAWRIETIGRLQAMLLPE